jgi:membrane protease YdiL (CAAX protease family)
MRPAVPVVVRKHKERGQILLQAFGAYTGFCLLCVLGHWVYAFFGLAVVAGIAIPLIWAARRGCWSAIRLTGWARMSIWGWGVLGGAATSAIGLVVIGDLSVPPRLGLQLAIGVPLWAFVAVPFQELLFRGWLQVRLEEALGARWGLAAVTIAFTLWHYLAPLSDQTSFPLKTPLGFVATLAAGWIYGVSAQQSKSVLSAWLAHTLSGIAFIAVGAADVLAQVQSI